MAVAPLYTTPYDPSYGTARMSELVRRRGDIQAQSALAQGAARAQMGHAIGQGVSGLMSDLVRLSEVNREQKRRDQEMAIRQQDADLRAQNAKYVMNQREQADNDQQFGSATVANYTTIDEQTGKPRVNRDAIRADLLKAGRQDLVTQLEKTWQETDRLKQQNYINRHEGGKILAIQLKELGADDVSTDLAIAEALDAGFLTPDEAASLKQRLNPNKPGEVELNQRYIREHRNRVLDSIINSAPSSQKDREPRDRFLSTGSGRVFDMATGEWHVAPTDDEAVRVIPAGADVMRGDKVIYTNKREPTGSGSSDAADWRRTQRDDKLSKEFEAAYKKVDDTYTAEEKAAWAAYDKAVAGTDSLGQPLVTSESPDAVAKRAWEEGVAKAKVNSAKSRMERAKAQIDKRRLQAWGPPSASAPAPVTAPAPVSVPTSGIVKVRAPDGTIAPIRASQLEAALKAGGTLVR